MRKLLLGIGAQKAGTTWLFEQLRDHPEVGYGWKKELGLWGEVWNRNLRYRKPRRLRSKASAQIYCFPNGKRLFLHPMFSSLLAKEYFAELEKLNVSKHQVIADITPNYAGISRKGFTSLRALCASHGFAPQILFIMRDPVERTISGILHANRAGLARNPDLHQKLVLESFKKYPVAIRSRYDLTIANVEAAFPESDIKYLFYESLFNETAMEDLSLWLGIRKIEANFDLRIGLSPTPPRISDSLKSEIRAFLSPVYDFCDDRFGRDNISSLWSNH